MRNCIYYLRHSRSYRFRHARKRRSSLFRVLPIPKLIYGTCVRDAMTDFSALSRLADSIPRDGRRRQTVARNTVVPQTARDSLSNVLASSHGDTLNPLWDTQFISLPYHPTLLYLFFFYAPFGIFIGSSVKMRPYHASPSNPGSPIAGESRRRGSSKARITTHPFVT